MKSFYYIYYIFFLLSFCSNFIFGQDIGINDNCTPRNYADSVIFFTNLENGSQEYNYDNYLRAINYFQQAEKILPHCSEIAWDIALCYWFFIKDEKNNPQYLLIAKKYFNRYLALSGWEHNEQTAFAETCLAELKSALDTLIANKYFTDGRYYGQLFDEIPYGYGIFYYNNGTRYEGEWVNGKRDGFGIMYENDSTHYKGLWKDGEKHDLNGKIFDREDNVIRQGTFVNGLFKYNYNYNPNYQSQDSLRWIAIENSANIQDYLQYLQDFKDFGAFRKSAQEHIDYIIYEKMKQIDSSFNEKDFRDFINEVSAVSWWDIGWANDKILEIQNYKNDDSKLWTNIKNSFDINDFNNYIKIFSRHGQHINEAQQRIIYVMDYSHRDSITWHSIKNKQYLKYFKNYVNSFAEHGQFIEPAEIKIKKIENKFSRMFFEFTGSLSAPAGIRIGGLNTNHWGGYGKFQTTALFSEFGNKYPFTDKYETRSSLSAGMLYAPINWVYFYLGGGAGFYKETLEQEKSETGGEVEGGIQFNLGGLSLSAGLSYNKIGLSKPFLDYNFGIGFNTYNKARKDLKNRSIILVNSLVSPIGLMFSGYNGNFGGYAKFQMPVPSDNFMKNYKPIQKHGVRYALSAGPTFNITPWFSVYGGIGLGLYQDSLKQKLQYGLETEGGFMFHIADYIELTIGAHIAKMGTDKKFYDYDIGLGIPTRAFGDLNDAQTIFQLSTSSTAQIGFMNEILLGRAGFYAHVQTTVPSKKIVGKHPPNIKHGIRHSFLTGGVLSYTKFLSSYAGLGLGFYRNNLNERDYNTGFETETGLNLSFPHFNLSAGLHWCRVGHEKNYLDYNLGLGINIQDQHLINWDWDIDYSSFGQFIYNSTFPYGFRGGYVKDWTGFYFGTQFRTKTDARLNLSGGLIGCVSSLFHVYAGVGAGFIGNIGMNVEGGVTINIRKIPISVGIKACDIKNSNRYLTFDFAIGWYDEDRTPSQIRTYYQEISYPPN